MALEVDAYLYTGVDVCIKAEVTCRWRPDETSNMRRDSGPSPAREHPIGSASSSWYNQRREKECSLCCQPPFQL